MADLSKYVEYCSSTTRNILSTLPQIYGNQTLLAFMPCALEINSNGRFKEAYGILLFNHEKHFFYATAKFMGPNLADWLLIRGSYQWSHMSLWSRDLVESRGKLKILYLHNHNVYGHKTWPGGDRKCGHPTHGLVRSRDKLNKLRLIFHSTNSRQIWQGGDLPLVLSTQLCNPLYEWSREVMCHIWDIIS